MKKSLILLMVLVSGLSGCQKQAETVAPQHRWQITDALVLAGQLSQHGERSGLLLADNSLSLWNNHSQQKLAHWQPPQVLPNSRLLHIAETGQFLMTANAQGVQLWDPDNAEPLGQLDLAQHLGDARITQLAFWQPPYKFIIATSAGDVIFADTENNSYRINRSHSAEVIKLQFSRNKQFLYSAGNDGLVIKWNMFEFQTVASREQPYRITSLAVGNDNQVFISDALKTQLIWDSHSDNVLSELTYWQQFQWFRLALFIQQDRFLLTSSPKTEVFVWDTDSLSLQGTLQAESQSLGSTLFDMTMIGPQRLRTLSSDSVIEDWQLTPITRVAD